MSHTDKHMPEINIMSL